MEGLILKLIKYSFVFLLMVISCGKQNTMPSKTREGKNTLGYSIDGYQIGDLFTGANDIISFNDSIIDINHYRKNNRKHHPKEWNLKIQLKKTGEESYQLNNASLNYSAYNEWTFYTELNDNPNNFLDVTYFSEEKRIVSGEFYLNLVQLDSTLMSDSLWVVERQDSVVLNRGRFDLKF